MLPVKIVDARMGRGKTTAAINFINANKKTRRFLYATPFLSEVERVRDSCKLEEPSDINGSKSSDLRSLIYQGKSVSTTHQLFEIINEDMPDIIREKHYTLIIDEAPDAIEKTQITAPDMAILNSVTSVDEDGLVSWLDDEYTGKFSGYKDMADRHTLYRVDSSLINTFNLSLLTAFDEVFILTYLFSGSVLEAYFQCFDIPYEIWGIGGDTAQKNLFFIPEPDSPPPIDYHSLVNIVDTRSMNEIGDPYHALAKNWYKRHPHHDPEMIRLRKNMQNFFKNMTHSRSDNRMWTCFKDYASKLVQDDGTYASSFLQTTAKAINSYSHCTNVAYMVNRFQDPNMLKFLSNRGYTVDQDQCALSEMLQWIWRSSIRNGNSINLYIPSKRMRELFIKWMDEMAEGGVAA